MKKVIITILFIVSYIIFICMSGCIDNNITHETNLENSFDKNNFSSTMNESSFVITRDGIPLRYTIHGQGPPVIFILGYGMTIDEWPHQMILNLARNHTVIVYNHRGISGVQNPDVPFSISQAAMDLHDVISQLAKDQDGCGVTNNGLYSDNRTMLDKGRCSPLPVDIIGYSMGGMVALEYVKMYPDSVENLVLISTDCGGAQKVPAKNSVIEEMGQTPKNPEEALDRAGRLLLTEEFRNTHPDPLTWFVDFGEVADPTTVQDQYRAFLSWEGVYADLPAIQSRTLVISGDQDIVIPPENSMMIANLIPNATLEIRKGLGHGMIFVEPEEISGIIGEFLEGIS
ncbi:alpha/beta fold hydrolase [Methanospirillum stamsii]|uniref:AB hydrolase-1 domain-containing protein n=1 Tax=Methanospirillum stamsii TaxID=1277351 RepID=A0A2V2MP99_9EURY|nr:alpha/beta hydrolase [Methanospirillum stamsii]PWR70044.1 hypothetical protein DLD82_16480 [Methanospirillum stamsii]